MNWKALCLVFFSQFAYGYDCSKHEPFKPVEFQNAVVQIGRFHWESTPNGKTEVVEEVCSTQLPLRIPVLDIRGREEEWFYCHHVPQPELVCQTTFQGQPTEIRVKPAVVLRNWKTSARRDTHFHAYIFPNHDPLKYVDLFARTLSPGLNRQPVFLDAAGGGRGEESGIDSFYVGADFLK